MPGSTNSQPAALGVVKIWVARRSTQARWRRTDHDAET